MWYELPFAFSILWVVWCCADCTLVESKHSLRLWFVPHMGQGVTWRNYSLCEMLLCGKIWWGVRSWCCNIFLLSQIDAIGGAPDVDDNSWGSFWWWMGKPLRRGLKGKKKNLKTKSLSLGGFSATDGLATPNLVWENFSVQAWVWGPNMSLGDFSYPQLGWQVQACFGSSVLAKGWLGRGGATGFGKFFVPKDGFKGPSMSWGGFSCTPHGMGIQGWVWEVFLEVGPHPERESAGVQVPTSLDVLTHSFFFWLFLFWLSSFLVLLYFFLLLFRNQVCALWLLLHVFWLVFFWGVLFWGGGGVKGQVRWPFGPRHLALNPYSLFHFLFFWCFYLFFSARCKNLLLLLFVVVPVLVFVLALAFAFVLFQLLLLLLLTYHLPFLCLFWFSFARFCFGWLRIAPQNDIFLAISEGFAHFLSPNLFDQNPSFSLVFVGSFFVVFSLVLLLLLVTFSSSYSDISCFSLFCLLFCLFFFLSCYSFIFSRSFLICQSLFFLYLLLSCLLFISFVSLLFSFLCVLFSFSF